MKWLHVVGVGVLSGCLARPCFAWNAMRLIEVARATVTAQVKSGAPPVTRDDEAPMGVFVTIERGGKVVGCRGTLRPTQSSLEREVARAARSACAFDPRYRPLSPADIKDFRVTVTLVERQTPLSENDLDSLSPDEGLVLQSGERSGIVLPFEGRDPRTRLGWAWKKAGVSPGSPCRLFRLEAQRFRG